MAETNCPFCRGALPDDAQMCPECGFRLGPEPERKEKLELTDEQIAALAGFSAAQLDLEERKRGMAAKGTKTGAGILANWPKVAVFVVTTFVVPAVLMFVLQKMGVLGKDDMAKMMGGGGMQNVFSNQNQMNEINKEINGKSAGADDKSGSADAAK